MKRANLHYITRLDYERTVGWWVRVRQNDNTYTSRLFSDKKHGGKKEALAKALRFRDKQAPDPDPLFKVHRNLRQDKFKKLPIGTTRCTYMKKHVANGRVYAYPITLISGYYSLKGRQHRRNFNVATHGETGALRRALEFRRKGLALRGKAV